MVGLAHDIHYYATKTVRLFSLWWRIPLTISRLDPAESEHELHKDRFESQYATSLSLSQMRE